MEKFSLQIPINSTSLGQVAIVLLRGIYKKGLYPNLFLIGNVDLNTQEEDSNFSSWVQQCVNKAYKEHSRSTPSLKLWHIQESMSRLSEKQALFTFHELDELTESEVNTLNQQSLVITPSSFSKDLMQESGVKEVLQMNLPFDNFSFKKLDKVFFNDGRVNWILGGKLEQLRKRHTKVIQTWIKKYGGNMKHHLNLAIHNPFLTPEEQNKAYHDIVQGQRVPNIQFLGYIAKNLLYNDFLNSADVVIGMGNESWGLPEFQATAMGAHAIIGNYAGHKDWANTNNAVLVDPSEKIRAVGDKFFREGGIFNQGNLYDFGEEQFLAACNTVVKRVEINKTNTAGLKLQEFTVDKFTDGILEAISNL